VTDLVQDQRGEDHTRDPDPDQDLPDLPDRSPDPDHHIAGPEIKRESIQRETSPEAEVEARTTERAIKAEVAQCQKMEILKARAEVVAEVKKEARAKANRDELEYD